MPFCDGLFEYLTDIRNYGYPRDTPHPSPYCPDGISKMTDQPFLVVASGIGFTEGPIAIGTETVMVTSMSRGLLTSVDLTTGALSTIDTGGGPNGLAVRDGRIAVAQNGGGGFTQQSTRQAAPGTRSERTALPGIQLVIDGVVSDIVTTGCAAPNDLVYAPDGSLWFTDPGSKAMPEFAPRVSRLDLDTLQVTTVVEGMKFPNGLAFGPDGDFYVVDSITNEILRFPYSNGTLGERVVYGDVTDGGPDGIAFDAAGNLYVAAFETDDVAVFDTSGKLSRRMSTGEKSRPTNLCFAGEDLDTLVVTLASGGKVIAFEEKFEGAPV